MDPSRAQSLLESLAQFGLTRAQLRQHHLGPIGYRAGYGEFEADYVGNALLAQQRDRLVSEVAVALQTAGIPVVLLKGVSYAGALYDEPAERPMADVDLMVPPHDHRRARAMLRGIGFQERRDRVSGSRFHHAVTFQRDNQMVDLHRSIAQPGRVGIDLAEVWARAAPCQERTDGALRLAPVDEALFHFVSLARTQLHAPAISYVDGALLRMRLGAAERDALGTRARKYRVSRAVAAALHMTRLLTEPGYTGRPGWVAGRVLPSPQEVLRYEIPARSVQLLRKLALLDDARSLAGYLVVSVAERLPILRD